MAVVIDGVLYVAEPVAENLGRCYELAGKRVTDVLICGGATEPVLVHGTIQGFGAPPLPHAWVKEGDSVWEPATGKSWPAHVFAILFNPVEHVTYPAREAAVKMVRAKHYGPWHD